MKERYRYFILLIAVGIIPFPLLAQKDNAWNTTPAFRLSGFVDVFYSYDFNQPKSNYRQTFFYNFNRHNEFNLNLGYLKLSAEHEKYRTHLALQTGTYPFDNFATEPEPFKNIFEANVGIVLNQKNNLWLDAGIFASHIGFESAPSIDNWTLTRSILAENSPYYLSGAKLTFAPNKNWEWAAIVCNGWQHIQKVQGNSLPSFGTQLKYLSNEKAILNWSTFVGTEDPDTSRRMRYFNNFYGQFQIGKKVGLITGFDIGLQQKSKYNSNFEYWYSPVVIVRYSLAENLAAVVRLEYYQDKFGIIIPPASNYGFKTSGLSFNVDYFPNTNLSCRVEGRWLQSENKIFKREKSLANHNLFVTGSIAIRFNQLLGKQ